MSQQNQAAPADQWVVQEAKAAAPVPVGMYAAKFAGVADHTLADGSVRWRWAWSITHGPLTGQTASALTDRGINPNTLAGVLIAGLLGRPLAVGEHVKQSLDQCVGKPYVISVQPGPKGGKPGVRSVGAPPEM